MRSRDKTKYVTVIKNNSNQDLLAVVSFVTHPSTLRAAAEGLEQTAGPALENVLNTKSVG